MDSDDRVMLPFALSNCKHLCRPICVFIIISHPSHSSSHLPVSFLSVKIWQLLDISCNMWSSYLVSSLSMFLRLIYLSILVLLLNSIPLRDGEE